jgi:hypothetical protein
MATGGSRRHLAGCLGDLGRSDQVPRAADPESLLRKPRRRDPVTSPMRFGVGVHETTFRVNVRWVTPLGEETASTS